MWRMQGGLTPLQAAERTNHLDIAQLLQTHSTNEKSALLHIFEVFSSISSP
jgi:hypothetical protein